MSGRPRQMVVDEVVERAMVKLVEAVLDQPRPSKDLVRRANKVLRLVGHPLRSEEAA